MHTLTIIYLSLALVISTFLSWTWSAVNLEDVITKTINIIVVCVTGFFLLKGYSLPPIYCVFIGFYSLFWNFMWSSMGIYNKIIKTAYISLFCMSLAILFLKL
jgi:hypothetical protein